jgi:hypothetical protein
VSGRDKGYFIVSSFSDISEKIVPFFDKYPLVGSKRQDYLDFLKVVLPPLPPQPPRGLGGDKQEGAEF